MAATFETWVRAVFDHHADGLEWFWGPEFDAEWASLDLTDAVTVAYLTRLYRDPAVLSAGVDAVLLYPQNLTSAFFDLSSGEAGAILQNRAATSGCSRTRPRRDNGRPRSDRVAAGRRSYPWKAVARMKPAAPTSGSKALLVIDVQQDLFGRPTPIYHGQQLLANINLLAERAHDAGAPVVYIRHCNSEGVLVKGTPGWELHPALHPLPADLMVEKLKGNAFLGTPLAQELRARGVTTVVVTGLVTCGCVKNTCLGAKECGFGVVLVEDGHSDNSRDAARLIDQWNRNLGRGVADVRPTAEVAFP